MYMWAELATITQAFSGSSLAAPHSILHDPQNIENWNVPGSRNLSGVLLIKKKRGTVDNMAALGHQCCPEPTAVGECPAPESSTWQEFPWGSVWSSPQGLPDRGGPGPRLPETRVSSTVSGNKRCVWKTTGNTLPLLSLVACCVPSHRKRGVQMKAERSLTCGGLHDALLGSSHTPEL